MPRLQVYLPDSLYRELKERKLPASELLQAAVVAEVRRQELQTHADEYVAELLTEVGRPSEAELARADVTARRIADRALAARAG